MQALNHKRHPKIEPVVREMAMWVKALVMQVWGPEFDPGNPRETPDLQPQYCLYQDGQRKHMDLLGTHGPPRLANNKRDHA